MNIKPGAEIDITGGNPFYLDPASSGDVSIYATITSPASENENYTPYKMRTLQLYNNQVNVYLDANATYEYSIKFSSNDATKIPCTYNHGDILIQYTINEVGSEDGSFDVTWDCEATCNYPAGFTNTTIIDDQTWIESDNSDINMSNITQGTTCIQRFYMRAYPKPQPDDGTGHFPTISLNFSLKNNLSTFASFSNIITKPAILFYEDFASGSNASETFSIEKGYVTGVISGYTDVSSVIGHYLQIIGGEPVQETVELLANPSNQTVTWKSQYAIVSTESETYWDTHKNNPLYYIDVVGNKGGGSTLDHSLYKLKMTTSNRISNGETVGTSYYKFTITAVSPLSLSSLLGMISSMSFCGVSGSFDNSGICWIKRSDVPKTYNQLSYEFQTYWWKYVTIKGKNKDNIGNDETISGPKSVQVKINEYEEWISIYDGAAVRFTEDFEFVTEDVVASSEVFNFGHKKLNTILVKSDSEYDVTLNVTNTKYKGIYTDLDDEMEEKYAQNDPE